MIINTPHRIMITFPAVVGSSSKPPSWLPCSACHGAGGYYNSVSWRIGNVWVFCAVCRGGRGTWMPW